MEDTSLLCQLGAQTWLQAHERYEPHKNAERFMYVERAFSWEQILCELQNPEFHFFKVMVNENCVGYIKTNPALPGFATTHSPSVQLERLYLLKDVVGKGVGTAVLNQLKAIIKQQGYNSLWLSVYTLNAPAIAFYEKSGFKKIGTKMFQLATTQSPNFVYELAI
jgi:ribosomal protein S18 acetylase RimI-like enzyme